VTAGAARLRYAVRRSRATALRFMPRSAPQWLRTLTHGSPGVPNAPQRRCDRRGSRSNSMTFERAPQPELEWRALSEL